MPPAGISVTEVLSRTGKRPVCAATICAYGSVVGTNSGAGITVGTPGGIGIVLLRTSRLLSAPECQRPLYRSMSNASGRPWLIVENASTWFGPGRRYGRNECSTMPCSNGVQFTGNVTVSIRAGPLGVETTVPSRNSAVAPDGLDRRMSLSRVNGSKPLTRIRFRPGRWPNVMSRCPREARSRLQIRSARCAAVSPNRGVHCRSALVSSSRAQ